MATADRLVGSQCPRCTDKATKICSGCRDIAYCSEECQVADYGTHKILCKSFKEFQERPAKHMRRIVVFMPDEQTPRFMWASTQIHTFGSFVDSVEVEHPFAKDAFFHQKQITLNQWTGEALGCSIQLHYDDDFRAKYSNENTAVKKATHGKRGMEWRGPIFAYCGSLRGGDEDPLDVVNVLDLNMRHYGGLIAFLIDFANRTDEQAIRKGGKVDGVKINCNGERRARNAPRYESVKVPMSHPIFERAGAVSQISVRIDEPLVTWKYPQGQAIWREGSDADSLTNQQVTFLHISCDPNEVLNVKKGTSKFGFAPMHYQSNLGNVLVASASRKSISCDKVHALADYCRHYLMNFFESAAEDEAMERATAVQSRSGERMTHICNKHKQRVLDEISQEKWQQYLSLWKAEKKTNAAFLKTDGGDTSETVLDVLNSAMST